ncbi:TPA: ead/Ea22-like family protein, partial [Klebsiella pneumoniae]|nr:ead/Ea22-like family protein [Klebsiella pneumoniae]HEN9736835.1 ead/Ea22-like family protein [Klebsiella pneumoniae]
ELAQSLKAAAEKATQGDWRAFQYHDGRCGIGGGHNAEIMVCEHISKERPHDAMFIAMANPANVLALVEALEKAQKRIAELESRTVKMPHRNLGHPKLFLLCPFPYYDAEDMEKALAAAGIKVEAE